MANTYLVEDMIQLAEDEQKLFESILAVEFRKAQVLKEDGNLSSQTDSDEGDDVNPAPAQADQDTGDAPDTQVKQKWYEKLKAFATKIWEGIKEAFRKFIEKIQTFIQEGIVKRFEGPLSNNANLKGFEGIKGHAVADLDHPLNKPAELLDTLIGDMVTKDAIWDEDFTQKTKQVLDECNKCIQPNNTVDAWNKDGSANYDFKKAINIWTTFPLNIYKNTYKKLANTAPEKIIKKGITLGQKGSEDAKTIGGSGYNVAGVSEKLSALSSATGTFLRTGAAYIKSLRRAIIACGTYALKANRKTDKAAAKEEKKGEEPMNASAIAWIAGVSSDAYVDEQFAFI